MKALKEKRISLRSLWRRGLVILSLFALVFASCSDSSSDEPSSGPRVVRFKILTGPTNNQYYGKAVDLEGVTIWAYYSDGTEGKVTDISKFDTVPRVVTGAYRNGSTGNDKGFAPFDGCYLFYGGVEAYLSFEDVKVFPIARSDTRWDTDWNPATSNWRDQGSNDVGLNLVGKLAKTAYYADDDTFDFTGLELWADYQTAEDGIQAEKISFGGEVTWKIIPDYSLENEDGTYKGYVCVTVGEFIDGDIYQEWADKYSTKNGWYYEGVTAYRQLDKVYTVKARDAIELVDPPEGLGDLFLWEPNTRSAWEKKIKNSTLKVTYTNNETKTFKIEDLVNKTRIWYNENPKYNRPDWMTYTYDAWDKVVVIDTDFAVMPPAPNKFDKKTNTKLDIYYRGGVTSIPVNVYTTLVSVQVEPKVSGELNYTPGSGRDNDVDNGKDGPLELAKLLNVTATYSTADKSATKNADLTYWYALSEDKQYKAIDGGYVVTQTNASGVPYDVYRVGYGPYYLFGTDLIADSVYDYFDPFDADSNSTYSKSYAKWKKAKGSITQNITVRHNLDAEYVAMYLIDEFGTADDPYEVWNEAGSPTKWFNAKQNQSKSAKQAVTWVK